MAPVITTFSLYSTYSLLFEKSADFVKFAVASAFLQQLNPLIL